MNAVPLNLPLTAIRDSQCHFIVTGARRDGPHLYCGQPVEPGKSYCAHHHARVYDSAYRPAGPGRTAPLCDEVLPAPLAPEGRAREVGREATYSVGTIGCRIARSDSVDEAALLAPSPEVVLPHGPRAADAAGPAAAPRDRSDAQSRLRPSGEIVLPKPYGVRLLRAVAECADRPDVLAFSELRDIAVRYGDDVADRLMALDAGRRLALVCRLGFQSANAPLPLPRRNTAQRIMRRVANLFGVTISEIKSGRRTRTIVLARHMAMYLTKVHTPKSYPEIGRLYGGRDHTTVLHAVRTWPDKRAEAKAWLRGEGLSHKGAMQ